MTAGRCGRPWSTLVGTSGRGSCIAGRAEVSVLGRDATVDRCVHASAPSPPRPSNRHRPEHDTSSEHCTNELGQRFHWSSARSMAAHASATACRLAGVSRWARSVRARVSAARAVVMPSGGRTVVVTSAPSVGVALDWCGRSPPLLCREASPWPGMRKPRLAGARRGINQAEGRDASAYRSDYNTSGVVTQSNTRSSTEPTSCRFSGNPKRGHEFTTDGVQSPVNLQRGLMSRRQCNARFVAGRAMLHPVILSANHAGS